MLYNTNKCYNIQGYILYDYRTSEEIREKMKAVQIESNVYELNRVHLILFLKNIPKYFKYTT
jgi:hypothetical protein